MMMICGPRDEAAGTVSLRDRLDGDIGAMPVDEAITQLCDEVARRAVRHRPKPLEMGTAPAAGGDDY